MIFTKKPSPQTLEKFRKAYNPSQSYWQALEMNQNFSDEEYESYRLEYHEGGKPVVTSLSWSYDPRAIHTKASLAGRRFFSGPIKRDQKEEDLLYDFQLTQEGALHQFFSEVREKLVSCGQEASQGVPNLQEAQGYEWLRVSLELLKKALEDVRMARSQGGPEVCQGLLFCGNHPVRKQFVFRLRLFNLDIEAMEDDKKALRVQVFDKKNQDTFSGVQPSLQTVFHAQKAPIIDSFIQILPSLSTALLQQEKSIENE